MNVVTRHISVNDVLDCFAVLIEQIKSLFTRTLQFGPHVTSVFFLICIDVIENFLLAVLFNLLSFLHAVCSRLWLGASEVTQKV